MGIISQGITISFSSSFMAEIIDVNPPGASRGSIDMTHQGTERAKVFSPEHLVDWGSAELVIAFDPAENPPVDQEPEDCTIEFPDGTEWSFDGFLTEYNPSGPFGERMTANVTIKVTGDVSVDAGSSGSSV